MTNLYDALSARFPEDRSKTALDLADGRRISYGGLEAASARIANLLRRLGVAPGDRVMVQVDKSPEVVSLYLGCLRAGAVYLPINTAYTRGEVAYFAGDSEPALVICQPARLVEIEAVAQPVGARAVLTLGAAGEGTLPEAVAAESDSFETLPRGPDDLAAILYTSGTTGRSKGAMLSHDNLLSNALTLHDYWGFRPDDVLLHALPIFHTHGLFVATNCALLAGATMLFQPKFDAAEALRLLPRATVMMGVPTFYVRLLEQEGLTEELCRGMRLFISGSAPLLVDTFEQFRQRTGHTILERYGMTETNMNTSNPLDGERRAGTVGFPLPGVSLRVVDDNAKSLPPGQIGVLEVKGPNVFKGYWRMLEKTAAEFRADGFFITGDVGVVDDRGYVSIVGRAKDLIISGGFNIYPKEVESLIDAIPGVEESAVIGLPHPDFGEAVAAVVKMHPGAAPLDPAAVQAALQDQLARFKQPKAVFVVAEIPRNAMGKVQKAALRAQYQNTFTA
ncbi:malonyl-CoA/methylmalonyl-CoA synthetase [Inquilinus ginsengisoli]|uniref:Malonyl-CoA/methylmalonyl-CoA synthetase n=1 Tax=Inquilinus ginsengisoli TaxID=363840 RepID=A0ABU1JIP4_9PROT|nr:malonyl-CoA synthase [Inquilinus ginsengisoli]MDR6288463.1 malonyl-CoA/methylmalonyl-CoA synthetase [Inquilinus ginsengisoli]